MAFEMVTNAKIDCITDLGVCIGISVDLSVNADKAIVLLDVLLANKVRSIYFYDKDQKTRIQFQKGDPYVQYDTQTTIMLPENSIEIIRNMLLDVLMGQGFPGYHYDIEICNPNFIDVCFILQ